MIIKRPLPPAACAHAVAQRNHGALISLDGKTVKVSFDRAIASSPLHRLSAWCSDNGGLIIGQTRLIASPMRSQPFRNYSNCSLSKAVL
jgi:hypothetical protein